MTKSRNNHQRRKRANIGPSGLILGLSLFALSACAPKSEQDAEVTANPPVEVSLPATAVTGEVPGDLMDSVIDQLIEQENLDREAITIVRAESAIWPDGALGCPVPGEMYTHALVEGYWIVLKSANKEYDYRASAKGHFKRCKNSFKVRLPVG
jgi:hypothetical protein